MTPIYLLLEALDEIDAALAADAASAQEPDKNRLAEWRLGRSQLVDELLTVNGENTTKQSFADPSFAKIAPILIDTLRAQILAECGSDETTGQCKWARGIPPDPSCPPGMVMGSGGSCVVPRALWNEMVASAGGPLFAGAMDLVDALRRDPDARAALEDLLVYLGDPKQADATGQVESLTEFLSTSHDLLQVLRDDANLVPIYKVLAAAFAPPPNHAAGPEPDRRDDLAADAPRGSRGRRQRRRDLREGGRPERGARPGAGAPGHADADGVRRVGRRCDRPA